MKLFSLLLLQMIKHINAVSAQNRMNHGETIEARNPPTDALLFDEKARAPQMLAIFGTSTIARVLANFSLVKPGLKQH